MIIAAALLCTLCTPAEKEVINVLSDYGIKDKNAAVSYTHLTLPTN